MFQFRVTEAVSLLDAFLSRMLATIYIWVRMSSVTRNRPWVTFGSLVMRPLGGAENDLYRCSPALLLLLVVHYRISSCHNPGRSLVLCFV